MNRDLHFSNWDKLKISRFLGVRQVLVTKSEAKKIRKIGKIEYYYIKIKKIGANSKIVSFWGFGGFPPAPNLSRQKAPKNSKSGGKKPNLVTLHFNRILMKVSAEWYGYSYSVVWPKMEKMALHGIKRFHCCAALYLCSLVVASRYTTNL